MCISICRFGSLQVHLRDAKRRAHIFVLQRFLGTQNIKLASVILWSRILRESGGRKNAERSDLKKFIPVLVHIILALPASHLAAEHGHPYSSSRNTADDLQSAKERTCIRIAEVSGNTEHVFFLSLVFGIKDEKRVMRARMDNGLN